MKKRKAFAAVFAALAAGLAPAPDIAPSAWAAGNLVMPDGPRAGQRWDADLTPQLPEIIDHLRSTSAINQVAVRKSAQVGFTQVGQVWLGYIIDVAPAKTMMVLPTIQTAQDFNREKLSPSLEASPALRSKVRRQVARSADGSTALNKRFPGGSINITGANSTADLRSKTVKNAFGDEVDEWPLDLDGQGDPMAMLEARQISFTSSGDWKRLYGSTPTVKGASRIDDLFEAGDQRYWHVDCPHCGAEQRLTFFPDADGRGGLRFEKEFPFNAWYACRENGCVIEHHEKRAMVQGGRWVPLKPGAGRYPSYHLDALTSLLTTWNAMAEAFLKAKDDPAKLKAFWNLWLGQAWEERGEAPEWERLYGRREDFPARTIPVGALVFTVGCDIQQDGIYYEVVAWGRGKESWSLEAGFLSGDTADPDNAVWQKLDDLYGRRYPDAYGNWWQADAFAVDSGFNTNQVYLWTRTRPKAFAIKGLDGWTRPAIASAPSKVDVTWRGKKSRRGAELWPVGTWPLKSELYANLRKQGRRDGAEMDPPGYCHFGEHHDEAFFKQLTAEFLKKREVKGRSVMEWHRSGPNHWHDCRIYNMAMAAHLGVDRMTDEDWCRLEAERGVPPKAPQGDLLDRMRPAPPPSATPATAKRETPGETAAPRTEGGGSASGSRGGGFLPRRKGWLS